MRLLLIDDEEALRRAISRVATRIGINVVGEAGDGMAGVALAKELRPDCVLVDVRMPRMDGIQATREIKAALPETVVVILSAYGDPSLQKEAKEAGATEWVLKGARSRELCERLIELTPSPSPSL